MFFGAASHNIGAHLFISLLIFLDKNSDATMDRLTIHSMGYNNNLERYSYAVNAVYCNCQQPCSASLSPQSHASTIQVMTINTA